MIPFLLFIPLSRYYGRKILSSICDHPEFDKHVSKHVPSNLQKSVRDTVDNLRTKVRICLTTNHDPFCCGFLVS